MKFKKKCECPNMKNAKTSVVFSRRVPQNLATQSPMTIDSSSSSLERPCRQRARCLDQSLRGQGRDSHGRRLPFDFHGGGGNIGIPELGPP